MDYRSGHRVEYSHQGSNHNATSQSWTHTSLVFVTYPNLEYADRDESSRNKWSTSGTRVVEDVSIRTYNIRSKCFSGRACFSLVCFKLYTLQMIALFIIVYSQVPSACFYHLPGRCHTGPMYPEQRILFKLHHWVSESILSKARDVGFGIILGLLPRWMNY
jgi:hypothetical protein